MRQGNGRCTALDAASAYQLGSAKGKAGLNSCRTMAEAIGCKQFASEWDASFTMGYLLTLPQ